MHYIYVAQGYTHPCVAVTAKPTTIDVCLIEPNAKCLGLPSSTKANAKVRHNKIIDEYCR